LALTEALLAGRGPRGLVDTIAVNAAVAMWLTGEVATVKDGIEPGAGLAARRRSQGEDRGDGGFLQVMKRTYYGF